MRSFAEKPKAPQHTMSATSTIRDWARTDITRAGHDFSRMSVHPTTPKSVQPVGTTMLPGNSCERTGDNKTHSEQTAHDGVRVTHDAGALSILPIQAPVNRRVADVGIPVSGAPEAEVVDQPVGGGAPAGAPTPAVSESCQQPRSMHKLTSGPFLGGLTMDSYYPDLTGRGYYAHPGTGGTFDTGSRAGANIQLYGVIPSPCLPGQFHLEQTVTRTRYRINGVAHAEEGRTFDDIAKSGRDASRPPFRQEFLGGGTAPPGYIISMADPPSTGYNATSNIEHDRDFVTSLVGPGGRQSISWSLSTRIAAGAVTSNVLT
jgi:hypothetical protein